MSLLLFITPELLVRIPVVAGPYLCFKLNSAMWFSRN